MLAFKYVLGKIKFPCYVQPKLNGIRATWLPNEGLRSRSHGKEKGLIWDQRRLPHIYDALRQLPIKVDGELYKHGMSLQQINGRVSVKSIKTHPDVQSIHFHIFDIVSSDPFSDRWEALQHWSNYFNGSLKLVPTIFAENEQKADLAYQLFKRVQHYEGMMYRAIDAPYGTIEDCGNQENRWNYLLKRKDWLDIVCTVLGVQEGKGRLEGTLGAFVFETPGGKEFTAGSGLTDQQRAALWSMPTSQLTQMKVRIKYEMLSDGGRPLKPTIEEVDVS